MIQYYFEYFYMLILFIEKNTPSATAIMFGFHKIKLERAATFD